MTTETPSRRVVLIEPRPLYRQMFSMLIEETGGFDLVWRSSGEFAPRELPCDIVLVTAGEGQDITALVEHVRAAHGGVPVVVIADRDHDEVAAEALLAGAEGFLPLTAESADVVRALRAVSAGRSFVADGVPKSGLLRAIVALRERSDARKAIAMLTTREFEVAGHFVQGRRPAEIGTQLGLSRRTVEAHIASIYRKIGVRRRVDALVTLSRHGIAA